MRFYIIIFIFLLPLYGIGQKTPVFSARNYAGIMEGESGTALQLQTINGIRYGNWFAGIGTGLDYYYERSIPLFFSVARYLHSTKLPLYFTGDVGYNFPWVKSLYYFETPGEYHGGLYWGTGLGYKFGFKNSNALLIDLGYNYKRLTQTYEQPVQCLVPPCPTYKEFYDYRLKRLSIKIGWMF
jgi:hypothetical protein